MCIGCLFKLFGITKMWTKTKLKLLSAPELVQHADASNDMEPAIMCRGLKFRLPENTAEELTTIRTYQNDLRKVLSVERLSKRNARSIAIFEEGKIKITKRVGKATLFGVHDYLEPHEALFLMEVNRLEVYVDSIIVSLERGYKIFLADDFHPDQVNRLTLSEYLVFSHFARAGCNLRKYTVESEMSSQDTTQADVNITESSQHPQSSASNTNHLYVWNYLYELLGHQKQVTPLNERDNENYMKTKLSMDSVIKKFRNNSRNECNDIEMKDKIVNETGEIRKREFSFDECSPSRSKLMKLSHLPDDQYVEQYFGNGSTNDFMNDYEFNKFSEIFNKIDIIKLKVSHIDESANAIQLKFSFDFWTTTDHQTTKCNRPQFRIIISNTPKSLPHSDDVLRLYNSQIHKAAIIMVCLNEELSFQAYVYRFTK